MKLYVGNLPYSMTDAELRSPWMQDAASATSAMILEHQADPIDGGALYHATHGLYIYQARVFGKPSIPTITRLHVSSTVLRAASHD